MEKGLYVVLDARGKRINYIYWNPEEDPGRAAREGVTLVYDQPSPFAPPREELEPPVVPEPRMDMP